MEKLRAKLKKQGGFTLVEMLIVVAIIAILIAISIPLVNGALERARDATDQANERAAKAEALLYYTGTAGNAELAAFDSTYVPGSKLEAYYDGVNGTLVKYDTSKKPTGYGKCTNQTGCYQTTATHVNKVIKVTVDAGVTTIEWE